MNFIFRTCLLLLLLFSFTTMRTEASTSPVKSWNITFSKSVNMSSLTKQNVYIQAPSGQLHPIAVTQKSASTITITPLAPYRETGTHTIVVSDAASVSGELLQKPFTYMFSFTPTEKATWIWNAYTLTAENAQFLIDEHVTKVYVQVEPAIPDETYAAFFELLSQHHIDIYALEGFAELQWQQANKTASYLQWVAKFQAKYGYLRGIHVDIEPYTHPSWHTHEQQLLQAYFDYIIMLQQYSKQHTLRFEIDIPFWFDELTYTNKFGQGNVAHWLIDATDAVTVMAYHNEAHAIITLVAEEYAYAQSQSKNITIAIETAPSLEDSLISFSEHTPSQLYEAMHLVQSTYNVPIAIHYLQTWQHMLK